MTVYYIDSLFHSTIDISLDLLQRFPSLGIAKDHSSGSPLNELASTRAGLFSNSSHLKIWERWIYDREVCIDVQNEEEDQGNRKQLLRKGINGLYQMKLLHVRTIEILEHMCVVLRREENLNYMQSKFFQKALFQAVERGHLTFIAYMRRHDFRRFLDIINEYGKTVFQFAAEHRQDKIFSIILTFVKERREEIVGKKDEFGNNMLHVVGKLSPSTHIVHIRGAAFQMQNELQWFKKVERMANLKDINCVNSDGLTPQEVFTVNHRDLVKAGELAMKETATSSSALVAALIITIMFAAAVTVPGGLNGDTGIPIYLHTKAFRIFIVADVISLCSSTTSVMVFLGILTSRFAEEDFLTSLPKKLIIGFLTLFLSIGAMMIAFSSAIFIMLPEKPSIVIPSIVLASVPIASFLWMQLPFLIEIIISTYGFRYL
ncbi:putative ankyrin repeat-containing domain, PGG domain-containing protein [Rosa chinensis]|uniref:Putative ankyrin repeat-containing domain, PGG domain-containing protein n=1 Tax=Rosa chinensis TaxID=74649 RepID=A0A2P6PDI2_ROSCH|nr:putative ankyrin repeat-containing domain, PGG domain-containing protein [Rosa chinensis]